MLKQGLQQKMLQKLSPQQIQLMKLLQVPAASLEERIQEELESNPALEEGRDDDDGQDEEISADGFEDALDEGNDNDSDINTGDDFEGDDYGGVDEVYSAPDDSYDDNKRDDFELDPYMDDDEVPSYKLAVDNTSPDEDRRDIPFASGDGFQDQLVAQLGMHIADERRRKIGEYIIGNIDEQGYLRREVYAIVDDLAFAQNVTTTEEEVAEILEVIQSFDPPGVGARDLKECLILQLKRKDTKQKNIALAIQVLERCMDEFSKKHYDKIERRLDVDSDELREAINEILKLDPKPGNSYSDSQKSTQHIIPDFIIANNDGILELSLNSRNMPDLKVSKTYNEMLKEYSRNKASKGNKEAVQFVKQKIESAKWFIDALRQRNDTLYVTMHTIMEYQYEYFLEGDETKMKPMILKDIADIVGLDISTVSRVANSKYVQTHFGTFLLKSFFSESLSTDSGEEVSTREVKKILEDAISAETKGKPLTDDKLTKILQGKGYNIARRTVAKYREQLNIPVARLRKEI